MRIDIPFLERIAEGLSRQLGLRRFEVFQTTVVVLLTSIALIFFARGGDKGTAAFFATLVVFLISTLLVFYCMVIKGRGDDEGDEN